MSRDRRGRFLPGHAPVNPPPVYAELSAEQRLRVTSGNTSAKGRIARKASPWNNRPMCETPNARRHFEKKP